MSEGSFYSVTRANLENIISKNFDLCKAKFYAKELFHEVYKDQFLTHQYSFPRLNKDLRKWIYESFCFEDTVEIENTYLSQEDSSVKFIMKLKNDSRQIESVLIPERKRLTLCVSTQVGCAQGCRFCQTGRMGLLRSLSCDEIVGQLVAVEKWKSENNYSQEKVTNIVYMGMGEPLDNLDNVLKSAEIFCDAQAFFLSHNKITISTVGLLPQLDTIINYSPVCIALSLHSPFDEERTKIMPVNGQHSLLSVISCLKKHLEIGNRKSFLVQYTLIRGVNDTAKHAEEIIKLLGGYNFKINLIPLNEHAGTAYRRPDLNRVYEFQQMLKKAGLVSTIRLSKGRDIAAACGQLIKDKKNEH